MAAQAYVFPKDGIADDHVTLDFEGVKVLAPSRADEFITGIKNNYTKNISYLNTAILLLRRRSRRSKKEKNKVQGKRKSEEREDMPW